MPPLKKFLLCLALIALVLGTAQPWALAHNAPARTESTVPASHQMGALLQSYLNDFDLGPVSIGGRYDSTLGAIAEARFAARLDDEWAAGLLGEAGPNHLRLNATVGYQPWENAQIKFSGEYLSQTLPFTFTAGTVDQRAEQNAFGFQLRQNIGGGVFETLGMGGYWAEAKSDALAPITLINNNFAYTDARRLAGATSRGFNIGSDLRLTPTTQLNAKLLYDDIDYDTMFISGSVLNRSGLGGALHLDQIINDNMKLSLKAETRQLLDSYSSELHWQPANVPFEISLLAQRLSTNDNTPPSNIFGMQLGFALGERSAYRPRNAPQEKLGDLLAWVRDPAVRMERVMVHAEERITQDGPVLLSISPSSGPVTGGGTVTITGTNFLPGVVVKFAGVNATVISVTPTQIVVTVPDLSLVVVDNSPSPLESILAALSPISNAWAATSTRLIDIEVINPDGQHYTFQQEYTASVSDPVFTSVTPNTGANSGGTSVTISGSIFTGATSVTFGGTAAPSFTVVNDTTLTATTPAHAAGAVDIVITTPQGSVTAANAFTYTVPAPTVTAISPTSGETAGGTSVTITGTNFTGATAVTFGSTAAASFTVNSATSITATSPAGSAGTVDVTVTTADGTSATSGADQFTYTNPHIIFVTNAIYSGDLDGFSGADAKCNADAAKPGGFASGYTYKALLNGNNATTSGVTYYRSDGTTVIATATGGNLVGSNSLTNSISTSASPTAWTGAGVNNCSSWTSTAGSGDRGAPASTTSTYWNTGSSSCAGGGISRALYCVSQ